MSISRRSFLGGLAAGIATLSLPARADWSEVSRYNRENDGSSLLILQGGKVVARDGDGAAHELASGTKSFWGVLAVLLAKQNKLDLHEPLGEVLAEWKQDARGKITLDQLLSLSSGLEGGPNMRPPTFQDAVRETKLIDHPGTVFHYGPSPYQIFGAYVNRKFRTDPLALLQLHVLTPAGVSYERWKRGSDGNIHLPSGAGLTAVQWANFGKWVMAHRSELDRCFQGSQANPAYGLTWWLNQPVSASVERHLGRNMAAVTHLSRDPALPKEILVAAGAGDQRLFLIPSHDIVAVRQAGQIIARRLRGRNNWSDLEFLRRLMAAL